MMITESLVQAEKGRRAKAKVAPRLHFEADPNGVGEISVERSMKKPLKKSYESSIFVG
jgi:hypothetical protein